MIMKNSSSSEIPIQTYWTKTMCGLFRTSEILRVRRETETKPNKPKLSVIYFDMYIHNFSQMNKLRVWPSRSKVKVVVEVHVTYSMYHSISQTRTVGKPYRGCIRYQTLSSQIFMRNNMCAFTERD